jgi:cytochrome bd ubiquinol oxidase subunit II
MASLWFWIVAAMIVAYLVLDGFDLGAGAIYLIAARTNDERRRLLRAIGPVWDGNELWLIAIGATLYFAFPRLYAASFGGFCMLLTVVLGLLVIRGIGAELRRHIGAAQWQAFFDVVFCVSSILLIVSFGVMMGNVVRGVPLDSNGYFSLPLWTNFKLSSAVGIFDWYTVLIGALALITFTAHGAYYIALKTDGDLGRRARGFALLCWPVQFFLTICSMVATYFIQPDIVTNYQNHKIGVLVPIFIASSLVAMLWANPKSKEKLAFIASSLYIAFMLAGAAFAVYPVMLPGRDHQYDITIYNAGGGRGLSVGLAWGTLAAVLAIAGFVFLYRTFGGKVATGEGNC